MSKIRLVLAVLMVYAFAPSQSLRATNVPGYTVTVSSTNIIAGEPIKVEWTVPIVALSRYIGMFPFGGGVEDKFDSRRVSATNPKGKAVFVPFEDGVFEFVIYTDRRGEVTRYAFSPPIWVRSPVENLSSVKNFEESAGRTNIVFFGDSLFAGFGLSPEQSVVSKLRAMSGLNIIDSSVSGDNTRDALLRVGKDVNKHKPRAAFVCLGGKDFIDRNDFISENDISNSKTFEDLRIIIHLIQEEGSVTVVVGVQDEMTRDNVFDDYRMLAEDTHSIYVPNILQDIIGRFDRTTLDLIHPNDDGTHLMAERLFPVLAAVTRETPLVLRARPGPNDTMSFGWDSLNNSVYFIQEVTAPGKRELPKYLATVSGTGDPIEIRVETKGAMGFFQVRERRLPAVVFDPY